MGYRVCGTSSNINFATTEHFSKVRKCLGERFVFKTRIVKNQDKESSFRVGYGEFHLVSRRVHSREVVCRGHTWHREIRVGVKDLPFGEILLTIPDTKVLHDYRRRSVTQRGVCKERLETTEEEETARGTHGHK